MEIDDTIKTYFDTMPTERYINHIKTINLKVEENIERLFENNKSRDFYLGMIAGIKAMYEVTNNATTGKAEDMLLHIALDIQKTLIKNL
jgi:hypothetical protein